MSELTEETAQKLIDAIERDAISRIIHDEMKSLGHRIVYDIKTGWSKNIVWAYCDPAKLDKSGYQVRP